MQAEVLHTGAKYHWCTPEKTVMSKYLMYYNSQLLGKKNCQLISMDQERACKIQDMLHPLLIYF